tara:strand:- start:241 stop:366 length:126 start_codon:yes stop_codon:yes gene_type:complete
MEKWFLMNESLSINGHLSFDLFVSSSNKYFEFKKPLLKAGA